MLRIERRHGDHVSAVTADGLVPVFRLERASMSPGSPLRQAIEYMGGIWKGLGVFLENPAVDLDNNRTDRALRGVVLGRKNHYGSRSVRGTEVAALFYDLIESAKLVGVDPSDYLLRATRAALSGAEIPLPHELG